MIATALYSPHEIDGQQKEMNKMGDLQKSKLSHLM